MDFENVIGAYKANILIGTKIAQAGCMECEVNRAPSPICGVPHKITDLFQCGRGNKKALTLISVKELTND